jgi:hypothetical protein
MSPSLKPRLFHVYWIGLTILALTLDYVTGPVIQFPIFYLLPIALASWYGGRWLGLALAVGMPLVRVGFMTTWLEPWTMLETGINAAIRISVLAVVVFLVDRVALQTRAMAKEVRVLRGLLPICAFCKKIRDEDGTWQPLEWYLTERSEAQFSHTFCPECGREYYGELYEEREE